MILRNVLEFVKRQGTHVLDSVSLTAVDHWFFALCMRPSLFLNYSYIVVRLVANTLTPEQLCYGGPETPFTWTVYKR